VDGKYVMSDPGTWVISLMDPIKLDPLLLVTAPRERIRMLSEHAWLKVPRRVRERIDSYRADLELMQYPYNRDLEYFYRGEDYRNSGHHVYDAGLDLVSKNIHQISDKNGNTIGYLVTFLIKSDRLDSETIPEEPGTRFLPFNPYIGSKAKEITFYDERYIEHHMFFTNEGFRLFPGGSEPN